MKSIKVLSPYFGKLPNTFLFTLKTMEKNDFMEWTIITDDLTYKSEIESTKNVKLVVMSFDEVKELIHKNVGTNLNTPYKLCDYKPLYGVIFKNILGKCDYWGYCDLDMVFGDLYKKLKTLVGVYDKIFDLGHFSLYRNISDINNSYLELENYGISYNDILNSGKIYILDETCGTHVSINEIIEKKGYKVYRNRNDFIDIKSQYKNIYVVNQKNQRYSYIYFDGKKLLLKMLNKKNSKEYIYAHYQKRKFDKIDISNKFDKFIITPKLFTTNISDNTKNNYYKFDNHLIMFLKFRIKRKIKNMKQKG